MLSLRCRSEAGNLDSGAYHVTGVPPVTNRCGATSSARRWPLPRGAIVEVSGRTNPSKSVTSHWSLRTVII